MEAKPAPAHAQPLRGSRREVGRKLAAKREASRKGREKVGRYAMPLPALSVPPKAKERMES